MKIPEKAVLIYNPGSGKGKSAHRAKDFAEHWKKRFSKDLILRPTASFHDIRIAAQENSNADLLIFMGGDGTLSESLQGLVSKNDFKPLSKPVGLLPGGTGNSFIRDFGITNYEDGRDALLEAVEKNSIVDIDMAIVTYITNKNEKVTRICFNIFGVGVVADAAETAIKMRFLGDLNYVVGTIKSAFTTKSLNVNLHIDGRKHFFDGKMLSINNSRFTGGAIEIAPAVRVNDGRLFLMLPEETTVKAILALFPTVMKGKHLDHPKIKHEFVKEVKLVRDRAFLMNIDGELEKGFNPEIKIFPDFWKVYMPAGRI